MTEQSESTIRHAFDRDPALVDRVLESAKQNRDQWQLLVDIATYIQTLAPLGRGVDPIDATTATKKRKLESSSTADVLADGPVLQGDSILTSDVSLSIPVRKKLSVTVHAGAGGGLKIALPDGVAHVRWSRIEYAFSLPVPEKAARASYFVLLLGDSDEQYVWTCPDRVQGKESDGDAHAWLMALRESLDERLAVPSDREFASSVSQAHRKGEVAYHVKAHIGSKEGFLFFLANGIVFGFKKPVLFYPFDRVQSISYTSVLQRTFNLVITTQDGSNIEFSMLDQLDFSGIDEYIKRHGLNDASMAAERQAKKYNVNRKAEAEAEEDRDETELARAEAQIQDEEDEGEEDYDPGSEGESEGEGDSDEDAEQDARDDDDTRDEI